MDYENGLKSDGNISMEIDETVDIKIVSQCLSEPVLCREAMDGQVPALLREMYEFLQPANELEAFGVVLHVLMLETGFNVQCVVNIQIFYSDFQKLL